jgi:hypothetical protein
MMEELARKQRALGGELSRAATSHQGELLQKAKLGD